MGAERRETKDEHQEPRPERLQELKELHDAGVKVVEDGQRSGMLRRDLPARFILTAFMGLVRNWFEERKLIHDESDPESVAKIDAEYLESMWTVFSEGLLAAPAAG